MSNPRHSALATISSEAGFSKFKDTKEFNMNELYRGVGTYGAGEIVPH